MHSVSKLSSFFLATLANILLVGNLQAGTIGAAQGFGAFIFGNSTDTSDIASRIAIGGNAPSNVISVGNGIQAGPTILTSNPNVVAVVEGNGANGGLSLSGGSQQAYNAGGNVQNGTKITSDPFLVPANGGQSISSYKTFYANLSSQLSSLSSTAGTSITSTGQGLLLSSTGVSATTVVYNLTAAQWAGLGGFNFKANQTIIVNVNASGSVTGGTSYNLTANGSQAGNSGTGFGTILFNFVGATGTVDLGNEGFGTILAPNALVQNSGSVVNGQIIANRLGSIGELHDGSYFTGTIPSTGSAPEPGTMLLFGGGLLAFGVFGKRFTKRRSETTTKSNVVSESETPTRSEPRNSSHRTSDRRAQPASA
jgi:choice-of-anchor A domain-containing protein